MIIYVVVVVKGFNRPQADRFHPQTFAVGHGLRALLRTKLARLSSSQG